MSWHKQSHSEHTPTRFDRKNNPNQIKGEESRCAESKVTCLQYLQQEIQPENLESSYISLCKAI